jgi:hypothetical protein
MQKLGGASMEWTERYNRLTAELEEKGIDPSQAAMVDMLPWYRDKVKEAGAMDAAKELIQTIDELIRY